MSKPRKYGIAAGERVRRISALQAAKKAGKKVTAAQPEIKSETAPKVNPYQRLIAKLKAGNKAK